MRPLLLAVLALAVAAAPAAADRPTLRAGSSQQAVQASQGSGCYLENGTGGCVDAAYPLALKGILFVRRGHRLALDFSIPVDSVSVSHGVEVRREADGSRWTGVLPRNLPAGFLRLSVSSRFSAGDQHFEAGLHVVSPRTGRVRVPKVAGLSQLDAFRALERRGLMWRFERSGPRFFDSGPPIPPNAVMAQGPPVRTQSIRPGRRVRRGTAVLLGLR